ncbi:MAG: zinc ABC transporter substrate-binding protein [Rhodospirillales bacterium]|nr:zinc ABC transporter substrate-binding protein [Rhodospirillales bacterium]
MTRSAALLASLCLALAFPVRAETPRVVVSIPPIHSLVAGVMEGIATPELLVKGGASPHTYSLKPSDAKALAEARLVFWVGEGLEAFLVKPLAALAGQAKVVELIEVPDLRRLPYRTAGAWKRDDHGHDHADKKKATKPEKTGHGHAHGDTDAHIWLAPANARVLAAAIMAALVEADPANAARFRANGQRLHDRLAALEADMKTVLMPVKDRPFVVFHDAYQYLEDAFGLNAIGAVAVAPEKPPGPKSLAALRKRIIATRARCVFREPQFPANLAETVAEGTGARIAILDPEGISGNPGANLYFDLMRANVRALAECLGAN